MCSEAKTRVPVQSHTGCGINVREDLDLHHMIEDLDLQHTAHVAQDETRCAALTGDPERARRDLV